MSPHFVISHLVLIKPSRVSVPKSDFTAEDPERQRNGSTPKLIPPIKGEAGLEPRTV